MEILHNNRCSKSRCALEFLAEKGVKPAIVDYLTNPLTEEEITVLLTKLGIKASELVRTSEEIYKSKFKGKKMTQKTWIKALAKYPQLIERPIVIDGDKAIIARPAESLEAFLNGSQTIE